MTKSRDAARDAADRAPQWAQTPAPYHDQVRTDFLPERYHLGIRFTCSPVGSGYLGIGAGTRSTAGGIGELGDVRLDQPLEVGIPHAHGVGVGAGPENYDLVFR